MANSRAESGAESAEVLAAELFGNGYCIIPNIIPTAIAKWLDKELADRFVRTPFCEGEFYGSRTKRFGALLKHSSMIADLVQHPLILAIADQVLGLWCDNFNLNLTQGIEIHPGAPAQFPHRDQDMWLGPKGEMQYLLNVIWPLNDFTAENGATLIWPGSHDPGKFDQPPLGEPMAAEMPPGSALLFLGSTLHGAGANRSVSPRRAIIISYCLGWLKPFENQWLCYPPNVARRFDPELARLVGYSLHRPNLGNYEGQSPSVLLGEHLSKYLAATDALRSDQEVALRLYLAEHGISQAEQDVPIRESLHDPSKL